MELFDLLNILFSNNNEYSNVSSADKKKHFFMINRRLCINFPLQAQFLQHVKMNEVAAVDFWHSFLIKQYNKTPYWMYTKGVKKTIEQKEKNTIKESLLREYAAFYNYDYKSVKEAAEIFADEFKKEIVSFQKQIS